jgi:ligand-binding SRPBCC domain-containing protein
MITIKYQQKLPISLEDCWDFFSSPENLKILTPEYLGFEIMNELGNRKMYAGQIIAHKVRPVFNIPFEWITEITHVQHPHYFVDEQRFGPYKFWHHEHHFNAIPHGVEAVDIISYKMPYGFIGRVLNHFKVKKDIDAIFSYRKAKLETLFGIYHEPQM